MYNGFRSFAASFWALGPGPGTLEEAPKGCYPQLTALSLSVYGCVHVNICIYVVCIHVCISTSVYIHIQMNLCIYG